MTTIPIEQAVKNLESCFTLEDIHQFLLREQVKGTPCEAGDCAIAAYIAKVCAVEWVEVIPIMSIENLGPGEIRYPLDDGTYDAETDFNVIQMSNKLSTFGVKFDAKQYTDLILGYKE